MNSLASSPLRDVAIDDKYVADSGPVYMSGTQALVRLPMLQRDRDVAAGLNTAGYISGYRGSPVGGYDQALWKAGDALAEHHVKFVPGTNEDLAATAIWGSQQLNLFPGARYDGVFGIWYGKGPGVDRSGDVFRHANQSGSSKHGGVIALAGDDHGAKSSTVAAQTDLMFQAVSMPVLAPATLQDYIDYGLHGFAMSRFSGTWVALKAVTDTIETAGIVDITRDRVVCLIPEGVEMPPGGLNSRWPEQPFPKIEERLTRYKLPAALAYARANRLDFPLFGRVSGPARLGIVTTGKALLDVRQALADLGIDAASAQRIGLKVYKVAMPWPLEPEGIREFCNGCEEILVVEEKRSLVESQLKEALYGGAVAPRVVGKRDETGRPLIPETGEVTPAFLARVIAGRIAQFAERSDDQQGARDSEVQRRIAARLAWLDRNELVATKFFEPIDRIPYFCSGCPHNTSTKVPEGSRALAGIGCHYLAQHMDRSTDTFTQMGGEGMAWVGQAPFSDTPHVFQNLGDGTYFHSGSLAIRHAVATRTRMTYKILFNDAVAMTGGQHHDGVLTPQAIVRQVVAEGVRKVVVVTDEPDKYPSGYFDVIGAGAGPGDGSPAADAGTPAIEVFHRSKLDEVQRVLRDYEGVSVLVYDQTCAAEKRRRRKRGAFADPDKRAFINDAVCEGCGDCGVQSNCVSVEPLETEFGRKRQINQSSCNKDYSCVNGFCPSFVKVEGGRVRRGQTGAVSADAMDLELPGVALPPVGENSYALLVTGIGGTGVITIGQLLGMAAHLEGKVATVLDMTGLAQKNGAVMSFVRIANEADSLHAPRIGTASADAVIGCDVIVTAGRDALSRYGRGHTRVVCNTATTPTADFTRNADWKFPLGGMESAIVDVVGSERAWFLDATRLANGLMGDAIASNLMLLGYAYQRGLVPVGAAAIERAIELNGIAIESNKRAFQWGRRAAVDLAKVTELAAPPKSMAVSRKRSTSVDEVIARRVDELADYQNAAYAKRYLKLVDAVRARERSLPGAQAGMQPLTDAVARYFFKLLAYKDEYEVARLYTSGEFARRLEEQFEGDYTLKFHLAPPLWAKRNARGELTKREYGPWVMKAFRLLASMRRIRGSVLDPFARTAERRDERQWIADYEALIGRILQQLTPDNLKLAVEIASIPEAIRGYGHVKARNQVAARQRQAALVEQFERPQAVSLAAA